MGIGPMELVETRGAGGDPGPARAGCGAGRLGPTGAGRVRGKSAEAGKGRTSDGRRCANARRLAIGRQEADARRPAKAMSGKGGTAAMAVADPNGRPGDVAAPMVRPTDDRGAFSSRSV